MPTRQEHTGKAVSSLNIHTINSRLFQPTNYFAAQDTLPAVNSQALFFAGCDF
jgi:hypothetical protein